MIRIVGEPCHIPRFLTANESFSCNHTAIQEDFSPEYQYLLKHRQSSFH